MPRGPAIRRADIERAIAALKAAGLVVQCVEIGAGGFVRVIPAPMLTDGPLAPQLSDLDKFRARRATRKA
jgi:hypothetical protein